MDKKTAKICGTSLLSGGGASFGSAMMTVVIYIFLFEWWDTWSLAIVLASTLTGIIRMCLAL
jgi:low affinity Fe/Cu permease